MAFPSEGVVLDLLDELRESGLEFTRKGTISEFLGIIFDFNRQAKSVTMTQSGLIGKILNAAEMGDCKSNKLPTQQTALGNDKKGEPMTEVGVILTS